MLRAAARTPSEPVSEAQHETERPLWARPELAYQRLSSCGYEVPENQRDDDHIVELAGHRNEVGHEIEGQREVGDEGEQ